MLPDGIRDVVGGGMECVSHLSSEETPATIAELPEPTLPTVVSTVSGKKLTLSCHKLRGPLKQARSYLQRSALSSLLTCTHVDIKTAAEETIYQRSALATLLTVSSVGSTLQRTRLFTKPPSFFGRAL